MAESVEPKLTAALDLIGRTGASSFQLRYSDDEQPVVWFCVALYDNIGKWETAAAPNPLAAALRLCERLIDGGVCTHCKRPAIFHADIDDEPTPLDPLFCAYEWDPELSTFRRSCEDDQ